jgi:D-alanyl-D-alanine carboxypeptidase (penicillin-binding protein 5/6)
MTAYLAFAALKQKQITLEQIGDGVAEGLERPRARGCSSSRRQPVKRSTRCCDGMIVQSGNDASVALAEAVSGSEEAFAELMNREAQRLGMKDSQFRNATGLPNPQHYSTAGDIATLARAIIRDFPEYYPLYSIKEYRYNNITQPNRNRLLWTDQYVDGMKTGYTEAAGYCLVASAKRGTRRLLTVVMGTASDSARAIESQKLLNHGFQFYDAPRLYEKNQQIAELPVCEGRRADARRRLHRRRLHDAAQGRRSELKVRARGRSRPLTAPIALGSTIGTLKMTVDGNTIATLRWQALAEVPLAASSGARGIASGSGSDSGPVHTDCEATWASFT